MKLSPLNPFFASRGASFIARGEWEVPDFFTDPEDEYLAARGAVIAADRSYRSRVEVQGSDGVSFLNNMLSNDVKSLTAGSGLPAALLSQKGKLLSDLIVYRLEDSLLLEMEPERAGRTMETLSRYIISEDVALKDVSDREALVSVEGPRAAELLSRLICDQLPELAPFQLISAQVGETPVQLSAVRHGPGPGYDLAIPVDRAFMVLEQILEVGRELGFRFAGHRTQNIRRIEAGIPLYGIDMNESHLLLETGLENAVSFNKGCYVGQEYVARLAHRGHLNRKLCGLEISSSRVPRSGDEILGERGTVGEVTSATFSPTLGYPIALGYIHRQFFDPGTVVSIQSQGEMLSSRVAELPFIDES